MKVGNLIIYWSYDVRLSPVSKNTLEVTECVIKNEKEEQVAFGRVNRLSTDTPNKDIARRKSMRKALKPLPREVRTQAWEVYRTMTPIPRWENKKKEKVAHAG